MQSCMVMETLNLPLLWVRGAHSQAGCIDLGRPPQDSFARSYVKSLSACFRNGILGIQRAGETRTTELDTCGIKEMRNYLLRSTPKTAWF